MEENNERRQHGQSIVLVAVALVALVIFAAIAVDVANTYVHRRTAQNAADAAALAGARDLGRQLNECTMDPDCDVEENSWAWYSDEYAIHNKLNSSSLLQGAMTGDKNLLLGGNNGPGFGWQDIDVYKLGFQWQSSPKWTWRAGYSYNDQPIPKSQVLFNILAPGVVKQHVTFGFTRALSDDSGIDFSFMYAPSESVKGPNAFDPAQNVEIEMKQYELSLNYSKRF